MISQEMTKGFNLNHKTGILPNRATVKSPGCQKKQIVNNDRSSSAHFHLRVLQGCAFVSQSPCTRENSQLFLTTPPV